MNENNEVNIESEYISNEDPQTRILSYIDFLCAKTLFSQLLLENKMSPIVNRQGIKTLENLLLMRNELLRPYRVEYNQRMSSRIKKEEVKRIDDQIDDCLKELESISIEHDHQAYLKKLLSLRGILTKLEVYVFNPKTVYDKAEW